MRQPKKLTLCIFALLIPTFVDITRVQNANQADRAGPAQHVLAVVNEKGKATNFTADQFAKLPRRTLKATDHGGIEATYEGVRLSDLLKAAEVTLGKQLKGPLVANCLLVEAADGYRAVFSIPEVDPELSDNIVVLADKKDGKALDAKEGPYRLIVPRDKLFMRWVRQVTAISVQPVAKRSEP